MFDYKNTNIGSEAVQKMLIVHYFANYLDIPK